jgi:dephospho-CoA kinase
VRAPRQPYGGGAGCARVRAIAFTGMPGAGKSVAVEVARDLALPVVRMGDLIWEEVRLRGLPLDNAHVGQVATELRQKEGPGVWAYRTLAKVREPSPRRVVIDGVRSMAEVDVFRQELGEEFLLVAIHASPRTRLRRLLERHRADDVRDPKEFQARDARELSWGIGTVIALADVMLENESSMDDLLGHVRNLLV